MSDKGSEVSTELITNHVRSNIAAALTEVATERAGDALTSKYAVSVPPYRTYSFDYDTRGYRPPILHVLSTGIDYRLETGANFNNGVESMLLVSVVEHRTRDFIIVSGWRYQAALSKLFRKTQLVSADSSLKLITKLVRSSFNEVLPKEESGPEAGVFRQETVLELAVEHYQNY